MLVVTRILWRCHENHRRWHEWGDTPHGRHCCHFVTLCYLWGPQGEGSSCQCDFDRRRPHWRYPKTLEHVAFLLPASTPQRKATKECCWKSSPSFNNFFVAFFFIHTGIVEPVSTLVSRLLEGMHVLSNPSSHTLRRNSYLDCSLFSRCRNALFGCQLRFSVSCRSQGSSFSFFPGIFCSSQQTWSWLIVKLL